MKKILIIKTGSTFNDLVPLIGDFEDWIIKGLEIDTEIVDIIDVRNKKEIPDIQQFSGAIITGSHSMVTSKEEWMLKLSEWIKSNCDKQIPILGICFGHQIIASSLAGNVDYHSNGIELGAVEINLNENSKSDLLLSCLPEKFMGYAAHSQTVTKLPDNAKVLAFNSFEDHHAFRVGKCIWGIQFHPEFNSKIMKEYKKRLKDTIREENSQKKNDYINFEENQSEILLKRFKEICLFYHSK